jgi:hypothetical protein
MTDNAPKSRVSDDEIDLIDLMKKMGRTLNGWKNAVGRAILVSIFFLFRRWLPLLLALILGAGISYLEKITSESFFTSDLILRCNGVEASELIAFINKLHTYTVQNNDAAMQEALSVNPETINNLIDISAYWIIDRNKDGIPDYVDYKNSHNVYDTTNIRMRDRMDIKVITKVPQELSNLRNGILGFINKDSLFQQRNRVRIRQNRELLSRLDYDIRQLDSLQKIKYFDETRSKIPKNGSQIVFLQDPKTQLVYPDIYSLYSKKQSLESERDLYKDIVTIMSDFSTPVLRINGLMYYGKKTIPVVFIATLLVLILLANKKKLEELYRNY